LEYSLPTEHLNLETVGSLTIMVNSSAKPDGSRQKHTTIKNTFTDKSSIAKCAPDNTGVALENFGKIFQLPEIAEPKRRPQTRRENVVFSRACKKGIKFVY
jgi:hypothetical protein